MKFTSASSTAYVGLSGSGGARTISLVSAEVYGLMVTGMEVTDTGNQVEPILVNGCSVDPYLFENFGTSDGDYLRAKFRAFKFPESSFVLFRGTVNVCLDTCQPVHR